MVTASIFPNLDSYRAAVTTTGQSVCLTIHNKNSQMVIHGQPGDKDALLIMADIFNDRFSRERPSN